MMKTTRTARYPLIIQGGMGVAVSSWPLAKAVSQTGQLGVVSGTGLDAVMARRLQLGDPGGHIHRALERFPFPETAARVLNRYYVPGGKSANVPFAPHPIPAELMLREGVELCVVANFVEVFLSKEDHDGVVGVNYMEKLQLPTLPSLFGAMLAQVDYVLMGAGIPRAIPGVLDRLCVGESAELSLDVEGADASDRFAMRFAPRELFGADLPPLFRPVFLAIVSSSTLATALARKASGRVDGFVVESPTAGGHNAPPRGPLRCNERGEPIYGPRDMPDLNAIRSLDRPFWLAGSYGSPEKVCEALETGATGVQVGTAFAFCRESGIDAKLKRVILEMCHRKVVNVFTDPIASPTGFPFKVLAIPQTLSDADVYAKRKRRCSFGNLRHAYKKADGTIGWRCPSEKEDSYVAKGGSFSDTVGRKCLCNALLANVGLSESAEGLQEPPLITCGDTLTELCRFFCYRDGISFSAQEVIKFLCSKVNSRKSLCRRVIAQTSNANRTAVNES